MSQSFKHWVDNIPSKGGLLGAVLGVLFSAKYHNPQDRPLKNAGKTALFGGAGFLLGDLLGKLIKRK